MDSNRDGLVSDDDDDEEGEEAWAYGADAKGAIVLVNCDADAVTPPARDLDDHLTSGNDIADLSPMEVRAVPADGHDGWHRRLRVPTNDPHHVIRIFFNDAPGHCVEALDTIATELILETLPNIALDCQVDLGVEAVIYPGDRDHETFDGLVTVEVELLDEQDVVVCSDELQLRVAPFIIMPNTAPPHRVLVATDDADFLSFVETRAGASNVISFHECNTYECDIWPQDAWEFGLCSRPAAAGSTWNLWSGFETLRFQPPLVRNMRPLQPWARTTLLGPVHGASGDRIGLAFRIAEQNVSRAYGGNLELIPPYTNHPIGRIVVGSMPSNQVSFLTRQEVQGPVVQLDTTWLIVGHVDEFMSFVPDTSGFARVFASPTKAKLILDNTQPHEPLFYGNVNDPVYQGVADGGTFNTLVDLDPPIPFDTAIGWYVRIYDGSGQHQIGRIISTGTTPTTLRVSPVWFLQTAQNVYDAILNNSTIYRSLMGWLPLAGNPTLGSKYVLAPSAKDWLDGSGTAFPALMTAYEARFDPVLWTDMNFPAEDRIDAAWYTVHNALNGYSASSINIPMIYLARPGGASVPFGAAFAYTPGDANIQVWGTQLWLARPFGPRHPVTREDLFANEIASLLISTGNTTFFIDNWNMYHLGFGEVHCGTNVIRNLPDDSYAKWWENQP